MKAKEYAYRIIHSIQLPSTEFDKVIYSVVQDLFAEVLAITKARKCACDSAYCAVFDEIDNKWITICRIVNEQCNSEILKKIGFRELTFKIADKAGMWQIRMVWKPKKIN
jgi:hypothetical protein